MGSGTTRLGGLLAGSLAALLLLAAPAAADVLAPTAVTGPLTEGQQYSGPVATFIDTPGGDSASNYTATIVWGDGASSPGTVSGGDVFGWLVSTPGHTYQEEGTYTITTTINDSAAPTSATVIQHVTVADAPLSAPIGVPQQFSGTGAVGAGTAESAFKAAIGGIDNRTTPSEQPSGLRDLSWDAIKTDGTDALGATSINAHTVALTPSRVQASGLRINGPLAVSSDGFQTVNPGTGGRLQPFTAPNLAAPFNSNSVELDVVAPTGTGSAAVPQATRGLGVVFKNVTSPNTTSIAYYNGDTLVDRVFAPAGGAGAASFVGQLFGSQVVTKVVITLGTAMIFSWDGNVLNSGPPDGPENLVAADDVALAEPAPANTGLSATAGVPFSGTVGNFIDSNPLAASHDLTAEIDWGDGSIGTGSVSGSGPFTVSGSHTYAAAGSYTLDVIELDRGGAQRSESFAMSVAPRATTTSVSCAPASILVAQSATCTATVTDTGAAPSAPTGAVRFTSNTPGSGFGSGVGCMLAATPAVGQSSCTIPYLAGGVGSGTHTITGSYAGDAAHAASSGAGGLKVAAAPGAGPTRIAPRCSVAAPSRTLAKRARTFRLTVSCDLAASVSLASTATLTPKHSRKRTRLSFGAAHGSVPAGGTGALTLKPASKVLAQVRKAAHKGARVTLSLSLTAINQLAMSTSTASVAALKVG